MIIRSQDKKKVINFDNTKSICCGEIETTTLFAFFGCGDCERIGEYSTEEKAIKVLDMIQNAYTQYGTIKDGLGNIHNAFNLPKVFQMPQDSEV